MIFCAQPYLKPCFMCPFYILSTCPSKGLCTALQHICICIYAFSRRFYPKRLTLLTVHSGYTFFGQYMCSLGIEPTFALLTQCSNHWATGYIEIWMHSIIKNAEGVWFCDALSTIAARQYHIQYIIITVETHNVLRERCEWGLIREHFPCQVCTTDESNLERLVWAVSVC